MRLVDRYYSTTTTTSCYYKLLICPIFLLQRTFTGFNDDILVYTETCTRRTNVRTRTYRPSQQIAAATPVSSSSCIRGWGAEPRAAHLLLASWLNLSLSLILLWLAHFGYTQSYRSLLSLFLSRSFFSRKTAQGRCRRGNSLASRAARQAGRQAGRQVGRQAGRQQARKRASKEYT